MRTRGQFKKVIRGICKVFQIIRENELFVDFSSLDFSLQTWGISFAIIQYQYLFFILAQRKK